MMIDVWYADDAQTQLIKLKALVSLIQEYVEDHARMESTFKNDFELIALNLSNLYDMAYRLEADLEKAIDTADGEKQKTPSE